MTAWGSVNELRSTLLKKWTNGHFLKAHAQQQQVTPISLKLKTPNFVELAENLVKIRKMVAELEKSSQDGEIFTIETKRIGGAAIGYATIPSHIKFTADRALWRFLGVEADVQKYGELLLAANKHEQIILWAKKHPLKALDLADEWLKLIAAYEWLEWNRDSGKYIREIDVPNIDTKFIEKHRATLAAIMQVSSAASKFVDNLGLGRNPVYLTMRFDPQSFGMPQNITEGSFVIDDIGQNDADVARVLIVENEISFRSIKVPPKSVIIWGEGYAVSKISKLSWLRNVPVYYWGDIDTHGYQILHQARSHLPEIKSVLMDQETLLQSRDMWGYESKPSSATLRNLTENEQNVYEALVTNRFGTNLRLEQERISWVRVLRQLSQLGF